MRCCALSVYCPRSPSVSAPPNCERRSISTRRYVGDHIFTDLNHAQATMRWRTALIVQELEKEIEAQGSQEELAQHQRIVRLLDEIDQCSDYINQLRTTRKRVQSEHEADDSSEIIARLHACGSSSRPSSRRSSSAKGPR